MKDEESAKDLLKTLSLETTLAAYKEDNRRAKRENKPELSFHEEKILDVLEYFCGQSQAKYRMYDPS